MINDQMAQVRHERDLLGSILGEIAIAAGIMNPDVIPNVAQLLLVGNDLLEQLKERGASNE